MERRKMTLDELADYIRSRLEWAESNVKEAEEAGNLERVERYTRFANSYRRHIRDLEEQQRKKGESILKYACRKLNEAEESMYPLVNDGTTVEYWAGRASAFEDIIHLIEEKGGRDA